MTKIDFEDLVGKPLLKIVNPPSSQHTYQLGNADALRRQHTMIMVVSKAAGRTLAERNKVVGRAEVRYPSIHEYCFDFNISNHYVENRYYHSFETK